MSNIPETTAVAFTQNWRAFNAANTVNGFKISEILPNAFTFDLSDVQSILAEPNVNKVRVYFGYSGADPAPDPHAEMPMRVMLVGVDAEGKDIIFNSDEASGIFDFASPCPNTCDFESPLML